MSRIILKAIVAFGLLVPAAFAGVDPALLALVMPDAKTLIGIQVKQTQASPFGQYLLSQGLLSQVLLSQVQRDWNADKAMNAAGFDPRRDLREILAASGDDVTGLLLLGRGSFQPARISTAAVAAGAVSSPYRGIALLTFAEPARKTRQNQGVNSLAFLDSSTVVAGNTDAIKAAIDRRAAGAIFSGPLAGSAREIGSANDAWVATLTPGAAVSSAVQGSQFGPFGNVLQSALQLSAGLKFAAAEVTLSGDILARTAQDAQSMADILRFVAGMIQSSGAQASHAAELAGAAQISVSGRTMHLVMSAPEQQVEQLFVPASKPPAPAAQPKKVAQRK